MAGNGGTDRRATRLHRTLVLWRRICVVSLLTNLILGTLLLRGCLSRSTARAILVDGKLICLVRSERAAREVYDRVLALKRGDLKNKAAFKQTWEDKPWPAKGEKIHTVEEAVELLTPRLDVLVEGWAIEVQGRPVVVLSTEQGARETLSTVKARFLAEGERALEPQRFEVEPTITRTQVPPGEILTDVRTASSELLRGTQQPQQYVVKPGDTPFAVAQAHKMTLEKLYELNPGLKQKAARNDIRPGDIWVVAGPRPTVVVITRKEKPVTVPVPFKVVEKPHAGLPAGERRVLRQGQPGEARQWVQGTWRNDKLVPDTRRVVRQEIIREPIDQIVAVGSALSAP